MSYRRTPHAAPRLAGRALKIMVRLLESPITRPLVAARFERELGIARLRAEASDDASETCLNRHVEARADDRGRDGSPLALDAVMSALGEPSPAPGRVTIAAYARAYREARARPEDVAARLLARLEDPQDPVHGLRCAAALDRRGALAAARESGRRHREGRPLGPLDGVPVLVKDQLDQRGLPTRVGTRFLGRQPATRDAAAVARLRAAGAVMLGKTRMHELGNGVTGLNAGRETPRNPHDPRRYTGGSSSGSAAAVAAGLCPLALGTDGGGSIRVPAALCGVVGLKPTFGRVDGRGAYPLAWSVGHIGPIAASVRDAALGYHALTGALTRPGDVGRRASAEGARVGVYRPWFEHAAPEVVRACEAALSRLAARGAVICEIGLPDLEAALTAHLVTISSELRSALGRCSRRDRGAIGLDVRLNLAITAGLTGADYVAAQRLRARFTAGFRERLREVDVIATPTTGIVAPVIRADALAGGESDLSTILALIRFTAQANLTGFPALSVPVGFVGAAPVGLQLIAAPWREQAALELGALVERDAERRAPQVYADVLGAAAAAAARVLPSRGGTARSGAA